MYNNLGIYDSVVEFCFLFIFMIIENKIWCQLLHFWSIFLKLTTNKKRSRVVEFVFCVLTSLLQLFWLFQVVCTGSLYQGFLRERLEWSYVNVWSYIFASWCKLECCFQFKFESTITLRCFIWYFTSIPHIARPKCLCLVVN